VILVTRLNGSPFAVNPDLLERVEPTPDTVLTLIDGTKYLVRESVTEVIDLVRDFRASVVVAARATPQPAVTVVASVTPLSGAPSVTGGPSQDDPSAGAYPDDDRHADRNADLDASGDDWPEHAEARSPAGADPGRPPHLQLATRPLPHRGA